MCWVNWSFIIMVGALSIISISTLLSGCGNKGALYLPKDTDKTKLTQPPQNKHTLSNPVSRKQVVGNH